MVRGRVIRGQGIGKAQGYPTANLDIGPEKTQLGSGVYAARAWFERVPYGAALIVASLPYKVEIHLFDYRGPDFYGAFIVVEPIQKVSEVISAGSPQELQQKITEDIRRIQAILAT